MSSHRDNQSEIPHGALVLICDGSRALMASNSGYPHKVKLEVVRVLNAPDNPATRDQGGQPPGRTMAAGGTRRSAVDAPDLHDVAERTFLKEVVDAFKSLASERAPAALALVAPPRALAFLREGLGRALAGRVVCETDKDLTKHPIADLERILSTTA